MYLEDINNNNINKRKNDIYAKLNQNMFEDGRTIYTSSSGGVSLRNKMDGYCTDKYQVMLQGLHIAGVKLAGFGPSFAGGIKSKVLGMKLPGAKKIKVSGACKGRSRNKQENM